MPGSAFSGAQAGELEQPYAFGLARQAVEPLLESIDPSERQALLAGVVSPARSAIEGSDESAGPPPESHAVLNGLFWLFARLAEQRPLVLALDDVHWADAGSQRMLAFLAPRLDSLPLLVVVTARPAANPDAEAAPGLAMLAGVELAAPAPLDLSAVASLVAEAMGADPEPEFTQACFEASGGNAFLLVELVRGLREQGANPTAKAAAAVAEISPDSVGRSVAARLRALGPDASSLARALAILDHDAPLSLAAELAGIDLDVAVPASDALVRAGLLAAEMPPRFAHPLLRGAVDAELAPAERARLHQRAASLLRQRGEPAERVAAHLIHTDPGADAEVARVLADAGRGAQRRGEPQTAERLLRRALEEAPATSERAEMLVDLGTAEAALGIAGAREHMREGIELSTDPGLRARALRDLTWQSGGDAQRDLLPLFAPIIAAVEDHDRELALSVKAARLAALYLTPGHSEEFQSEVKRFRALAGATPGECAVLAWVADATRSAGGTAQEVGDVAERAARHPIPPGAGPGAVWLLQLILPLIAADRLDAAEAALRPVFELAETHGSPSAFASASLQRALVHVAAGDLLGGEADARAAVDSEALADFWEFQPLIPLVLSLTGQGKLAEAEGLLAGWQLTGELPRGPAYDAMVMARGRLRFAAGRLEEARDDLVTALGLPEANERDFAFDFEAWLDVAMLHHALGDADGARWICDRALEAGAAWGGRRALGSAQRVAGLLRGGAAGIELLRESVATLEGSPSRLLHAHALVDLGAALRRANQRLESRPLLRAGIELAEACGANPLSESARRELAASGGRLPPRTGGGISELTPSELRVAEHAAQGLSNPEIAQRLFVTIKTVEMHLSNTYRKLEIGSRRELPEALAGASAR